jgi:outer membrane protein
MNTKFLLAFSLILITGSSVFAQTGGQEAKTGGQEAKQQQPAGAAGGQVPKMKLGIIDVLAFREKIGELKAKYEKLQAEFAPRAQQLEAMQTKLSAQEKTLADNKSMTPQQVSKLTEEFEIGKKEYQRSVEDSQTLARRREEEETKAIYEKLQKFMDQYCAKNGITLVFDARRLQDTNIVVYAAANANVTEDFVKEYNLANPFKPQATAPATKPSVPKPD